MRRAQAPIVAVVILLSFALAADLSLIAFGGMTADVYYLPLRSVPLGDRQSEVEAILIATHGALLRYQRGLWLTVHGSALGCAFMALLTTRRRAAP